MTKDNDVPSLRAIGLILGVSPGRVWQIQQKAMNRCSSGIRGKIMLALFKEIDPKTTNEFSGGMPRRMTAKKPSLDYYDRDVTQHGQ